MNTAPSFQGNVTPITNKKMWELLSLPPSALGHCWMWGAVLGAPAWHSHSSLLPWCLSLQKPRTVPLRLSVLICLMSVRPSLHLCMPAGISTISIPIKSSSFSSYFNQLNMLAAKNKRLPVSGRILAMARYATAAGAGRNTVQDYPAEKSCF